MRTEKCSTCEYFEMGTNQIGECHKNAPMPHSEWSTNNWPTVNASDWCGEYEAIP